MNACKARDFLLQEAGMKFITQQQQLTIKSATVFTQKIVQILFDTTVLKDYVWKHATHLPFSALKNINNLIFSCVNSVIPIYKTKDYEHDMTYKVLKYRNRKPIEASITSSSYLNENENAATDQISNEIYDVIPLAVHGEEDDGNYEIVYME